MDCMMPTSQNGATHNPSKPVKSNNPTNSSGLTTSGSNFSAKDVAKDGNIPIAPHLEGLAQCTIRKDQNGSNDDDDVMEEVQPTNHIDQGTHNKVDFVERQIAALKVGVASRSQRYQD
ncbi:hypothetical protein GOBAR_DD17522 [Gossypium barbadense]|nr:hypothetical protein GOBAR_DD17522 [Gossypium barbadense]